MVTCCSTTIHDTFTLWISYTWSKMFAWFAKALIFKLVRTKLGSIVYYWHYQYTIPGKYHDYNINYVVIVCVVFLDRTNHNWETEWNFFPQAITKQTGRLQTVCSKQCQLEQFAQDPWGTPSDWPPAKLCASHHSPLSSGCAQGTNLHPPVQILFVSTLVCPTLDSGLCSNFFNSQ